MHNTFTSQTLDPIPSGGRRPRARKVLRRAANLLPLGPLAVLLAVLLGLVGCGSEGHDSPDLAATQPDLGQPQADRGVPDDPDLPAPPDQGPQDPPELGADLTIVADQGALPDEGTGSPDLGEPEPDLTGRDTGSPPDAAMPDSAAPDAGGSPDLALPQDGGGEGDLAGAADLALLPDLRPVDSGAPVDGAVPDLGPPPAFCDGPTRVRYDPLGTGQLDVFPDDLFTEADPTTATGLRVTLSAELLPGLAELNSTIFQSTIAALSALDGFGTTAGLFFRFTGPIAPESLPGPLTSASPDSPIALLELGPAGPHRLPVEWELTEEGQGLILYPRAPLTPATRHALALTRALRDPAGQCLAPSRVGRALLTGQVGASLRRLAERQAEAVAALRTLAVIEHPEELAALTVFTTQSIHGDSVAVATWIREQAPPAVTGDTTCALDQANQQRRCTVWLDAANFLDPERILRTRPGVGAVPARYHLPVEVFLPLAPGAFGGPPYPVILFGHGLGGGRTQAALLARHLSPRGVATIAIDAVAHGDHPLRDRSLDEASLVLDFFGIRPGEDRFRPLALRDAWRQSSYDKLQVVRRVVAGLDVDQDGQPDLDPDRLAYFGVSLGGIMASELLSLSPEVGLGLLVVPGGRITSIIKDATDFAQLCDALRPPGISPGDLARFFPLLQTAVERGDSANYAPHVLHDWLPLRQAAPQLLVGVVFLDTVVPNSSNAALARALDVPLVPTTTPLFEMGLSLTPPPPVRGNLAEGALTAGLLQFDQELNGNRLVPATHGGIAANPVGIEAWLHFLETWLAEGLPEIIDPYVTLGLRGE